MNGHVAGGLVCGFGALTALIGSVSPWATVTAPFIGKVSVNGTDGDGVITLILAIAAGGCALGIAAAASHGWFGMGAIAAGLTITVIAAVDLNNLQSVVEEAEAISGSISVGGGLIATLAGGIITVVGGGVGVMSPRGGTASRLKFTDPESGERLEIWRSQSGFFARLTTGDRIISDALTPTEVALVEEKGKGLTADMVAAICNRIETRPSTSRED